MVSISFTKKELFILSGWSGVQTSDGSEVSAAEKRLNDKILAAYWKSQEAGL